MCGTACEALQGQVSGAHAAFLTRPACPACPACSHWTYRIGPSTKTAIGEHNDQHQASSHTVRRAVWNSPARRTRCGRLTISRWHVTPSAACTRPNSRVQRAHSADESTDATWSTVDAQLSRPRSRAKVRVWRCLSNILRGQRVHRQRWRAAPKSAFGASCPTFPEDSECTGEGGGPILSSYSSSRLILVFFALPLLWNSKSSFLSYS